MEIVGDGVQMYATGLRATPMVGVVWKIVHTRTKKRGKMKKEVDLKTSLKLVDGIEKRLNLLDEKFSKLFEIISTMKEGGEDEVPSGSIHQGCQTCGGDLP